MWAAETLTHSHTHAHTRAVKLLVRLSHIHRDHTTLQDEDYTNFIARNTNPLCGNLSYMRRKVPSLGYDKSWSSMIWHQRNTARKEKEREGSAGHFWAILTPHPSANVASRDWFWEYKYFLLFVLALVGDRWERLATQDNPVSARQ